MAIRYRPFWLFVCLLLIPGSAFSGSAEQSEALYNKGCALVREDPEQAERLFNESVSHYSSFEAFYALGKIQLQLGKYKEAQDNFARAFSLGDESADMANALAMKGQALTALGKGREGLQAVQGALQMHPEHPAWMEQVAHAIEDDNVGKIASAEEIRKCLSPSKGISVTPKVDLSIRFEYDSYKLDSNGKKQVKELAKALGGDNLKGASFQVVGHTDLQGDRNYNKVLSENRAKAVVALLELEQPGLKGHLSPVGQGMDSPLRKIMNDNSHRVNRRVEVVRVEN